MRMWTVGYGPAKAKDALDALKRAGSLQGTGWPIVRCGPFGGPWLVVKIEGDLEVTLEPVDAHDVPPTLRGVIELPFPDRAA
jgi:hypothetical protein